MSHKLNLHDGVGTLNEIPGYGITMAAGTTVPSDGAAGYAPGCIFQHLDGAAGTVIYVNEGTNASADFNAIPGNLLDTGGFTAQVTLEAAIAELYQHLYSVQGGCVPINLGSFREVDSSGDVGAIAVASGNGGQLASDTTPILLGDAAEALCIQWAGGNSDIVAVAVGLPPDLDDTADALLDILVQAAGTTNAPSFSVLSNWDGGTQVTDTAAGSASASKQTITATIAAADIPASPVALSFQLVPGTHGTDAWTVYGVRLRYKRKLLTA